MKKNLKKLLTLASTLTLMAASTLISHADWKLDHVGWWYQNADGTYPVSGWYWIDGNNDGIAECYYFDAVGYCLLNTVTPDGYIVDANGAWVVNGIVQTQITTTPPETTSTLPVYEWHYTYPYVTSMTQDFLSEYNYIVNVNTGKVHWPSCSSVDQMSSENKWSFNGQFSILAANGYDSCGRCDAR